MEITARAYQKTISSLMGLPLHIFSNQGVLWLTMGGPWGVLWADGGGSSGLMAGVLAGSYIANRMRKATIRQNRPMASDRAKPRMA